MIISDSSVSMASTRNFTSRGTLGSGISGATSFEKFMDDSAVTGNVSSPESSRNSKFGPSAIQNSILYSLMSGMSSSGVYGQDFGNSTRIQTYYESETTTFSAQGMARTADGRTIDFGIELMMSRSYMEYTDIQFKPMSDYLMDPLVINVDRGITGISDQKFMFDLDMDGECEEISTLKKGSGFLALDLNEDGVINDGRELFGARTGDGFGELRAYDSDGNGWIDEADEVFSRLKVWCKGEDGTDVLMDLKEANVGAIYLGEQSTEFSAYGIGGLNGVIRSTGFFLKEDGGVGTIQHVDLATAAKTYDFQVMMPQNEGESLTIEVPRVPQSTDKTIRDRNKEIREEANIRRKKRMELKKEEAIKLAKKRIEKKEMMDKQMEKVLEKRKEHAKLFQEKFLEQ